MRTTFISTRAMTEFTRLNMLRSQSNLTDAVKESTTGRHADVGLSLGYKTGQTVSFRQDFDRLDAISKSNESVAVRLKVSQASVQAMRDSTEEMKKTALLMVSTPGSAIASTEQAKAGLNAMMEKLNTTYEGAYVFGGLNSDVKPMLGYAGAAQTEVQTRFAALGPPGNITAADMKTFLDVAFAGVFSGGVGGGWDTYWTDASSTNVKSRISTTEMIETSANATQEPFRRMAMAFTMMADLANTQLRPETQRVVAETAAALLGTSSTGLSEVQATLAIPEQRIADSNDRIDIQKGILDRRIDQLEGVDQDQAIIRVNALKQQLDVSYAITGKLQDLSILKYL